MNSKDEKAGLFVKRLLPIGTIVRLKGNKKKLMILTDFACPPKKNDKEEIYDYMACVYPEGLEDYRVNYYFGNDDIAEIYHFNKHIDKEYIKSVALQNMLEGKKVHPAKEQPTK